MPRSTHVIRAAHSNALAVQSSISPGCTHLRSVILRRDDLLPMRWLAPLGLCVKAGTIKRAHKHYQ